MPHIAKTIEVPERLRVVTTLARLLQALETSPEQADPGQYRQVAQRLSQTLAQTELDETLDAVLQAFPAAAQVYENLHYAQAGLCRHSLDQAMPAELATRALLQRLRPRG